MFCPRLSPEDSRIIQYFPFRRQIAKQKNQGAKKRDYGADEIAADLPRESGRLGDAPLPRRRDGFAPRIELAFGDSASLGGYAARLSELTRRRRAQKLRRKTRLMEGEARDEGSSAELSDMRRRGSSDAR